ncbi:hypothetical protein GV845_14730 [Enterococcus gallinarum]|uniref:hypothetical protein n=1 Tax=Enterococcus gallinarum TaxID=1353 RepID=UPI0013776479|nr:hypothetical protein [Enterococcus gallinarum]NCE17432.1 hypothetical protein [Enterococcus gallinarum]
MSETVKRITELQLCGSDSRAQSYNEGLKAAIHILESCEQPQLNENQQIAINNAKKSFEKGSDLYDCSIDMMLYDGLTDKEWAKVTVAFLLWVQEQEEE